MPSSETRPQRDTRRPLLRRLRPFLRRDLRARLVSALVAVFVLTGLSWLGISALTDIDSREAHDVRVMIGLEHNWDVCGGPAQPRCSYDDREQAKVDREFDLERRARLAVLDELRTRIAFSVDRLDEAEAIVSRMSVDRASGLLDGDTQTLKDLLQESAVDLRPAPFTSPSERRNAMLWLVEAAIQPACDKKEIYFDGIGWVGDCDRDGLNLDSVRDGSPLSDTRRNIKQEIEHQRRELRQLDGRIERLMRRDAPGQIGTALGERGAAIEDLLERVDTTTVLGDDAVAAFELSQWLQVPQAAIEATNPSTTPDQALPELSTTLGSLARRDTQMVSGMVDNPGHAVWHEGWTDPTSEYVAIVKPSERYRSPITPGQRWQLLGAMLLALAGVMLVVVGPVVTATMTAREREAGTLPVLRMTGLSAGDLALAMAIGPNVFAIVAGGIMLGAAIPILALTAGPSALLLPLAVLAVLSAATHLTAIGLGDALGQRVNAMVVGGMLGLVVLGPGFVGAVMVLGDLAATGLLLGPLPAVIGSSVGLSGLPMVEAAGIGGTSEMGTTMLGYALMSQALLGSICLLSWRRRVERAWAPLFRPAEGVALALASVGCSALAILDLTERVHAQTYDAVNLITFVATGFLMPVLGWLLVSSLRRPARAAAVATYQETRRAFFRFQGLVVLTTAVVGGAYYLVMDRTGLGNEEAEVMWATLTQILLVAETAVATLLLASRRRDGRHRIVILGSVVMLLQVALAGGVYGLEVEHVALTHQAGMPFLYGMGASPYWLAFIVVLWAAGLGLILAAVLRERDRAQAEQSEAGLDDDDAADEEGNGDQRNRWLH